MSSDDRKRLVGGSLQRTVRERAGFADLVPWLAKFMARKRQVCRIEDNANPLGTGFLVGADLVLTNYHVVDRYIEKGQCDGRARLPLRLCGRDRRDQRRQREARRRR